MNNRAPLIVATVLLSLALLYAGSYRALVEPPDSILGAIARVNSGQGYYRFGGQFSTTVFWPVEQIDRRLRTEVWGVAHASEHLTKHGLSLFADGTASP